MRQFSLGDFDFALPPDLIAQHPAAERSGSRLLDGTGPAPIDRVFRELPQLLAPGDLLVFNDTQVVKPASSARSPPAASSNCWWSACSPTPRSSPT